MSDRNIIHKILTKEELLHLYKECDYSLCQVARKLGVWPNTIKFYMTKYHVPIKRKRHINYNIDHKFFKQDSEHVFYIAGFIAADGCVVKKNGVHKGLSISLSSKDEALLAKIRWALKSESPIRHRTLRKKGTTTDSHQVMWTVYSKEICDDLKRFNIGPRKSLTYKLPQWLERHPLVEHFIRGYNDGDGSFFLHNQDGKEYLSLSVCGTKQCMLMIERIFRMQCDIKRKRPYQSSSSKDIWMLMYGDRNDLRKIFDFLYGDATIWLDRKKNVCQKFLRSHPIIEN